MCGICGFVRWGKNGSHLDNENLLESYLRRMVSAQSHRGSDDQGVFVKVSDEFSIGLGHSRLSIIDLSEKAHQPLHNEDKTIWITFNGEIYNYLTLRKTLIEKGHSFFSLSDTEVLVHAYEEWGKDFVQLLDGNFAFAIWDGRKRNLLLCRDYFGVKPLHYYREGDTLRFSSEIKAMLTDGRLKPEVNYQAVHNLMNLRYNPSDETLFKGIYRLKPGHLAFFQDGRFLIERYAPPLPEPDYKMDINSAAEGILHNLTAAVKKQLVSDVPVGINLSGGIDSSSLAVIRKKTLGEIGFPTFTLSFASESDEVGAANRLAEEIESDHHTFFAAPDYLNRLPLIIWHLEEPKINAMQGFMLSRFVSQYVKVAFSGLGGDELFAGYNYHKFIKWGEIYGSFMPTTLTANVFPVLAKAAFRLQRKAGRLAWDEVRRGMQLLFTTGDAARFYLIPRNAWDGDDEMLVQIYDPAFLRNCIEPVSGYFNPFFKGISFPRLENTLRAEFWTKMIDDLLLNEDRMFMASGVESRVPLLDKDLVHFAFTIPAKLKMKGGETKYIMKAAMKNTLPPWVLKKKKAGFQFSSYDLFRGGLRDLAEKVLSKESVGGRGIFNYQYIRKILDAKPSRSMRWHYFFLLNLVGLEYWFRIFIDKSLKVES
ncbi:MAG: asparagine synthase (glutamine-hydrolyzing) [Deltaproteobacteria bacterium]|nr:asparagine synthase (glutamine-hydrolyzing) [Deltaproteobacteria bacterium]